jgi:hypothetical protein
MRCSIHRYVAAPCEGLLICEQIDLHVYNLHLSLKLSLVFTILERICEEFITLKRDQVFGFLESKSERNSLTK